MEKLDPIQAAHVINNHLQVLSTGVTDDVLKEKIASVQAEWRELAYAISAHLSGVEIGIQPAAPKKRGRRKKVADSTDTTSPSEGSSAGESTSEREMPG